MIWLPLTEPGLSPTAPYQSMVHSYQPNAVPKYAMLFYVSLTLQVLLPDIPFPTVFPGKLIFILQDQISLILRSLPVLPQELQMSPPLCQYGTLYTPHSTFFAVFLSIWYFFY